MALTQAEFAGRMLNDAGEALASKNVYVYDVGTTTQRGTDTTNGSGEWDITPSGGGPQYDVVMVNGSDKIRWSARDQVMNQTMQIVQPDNEYALTVSHTRAADSVQVAVFEGARSDEANEDEAYIDFRLSNSADEQTTIARLAWTIPTITDGSEEGRLEFHIMEAGSLTVQLQLDKTALSPMASDGLALGTAALEWKDLFLADGAVISFGDDQEVTLTHVHDTGILLSSTDQLQFGDSGTYIHQSADGVLDLVSDTEIEINATTVDLNGILLVDGTNISLDSTTTLNIDNSNTSNGITIGTATSAVPISIGHTTSETTVNDNLTVTGDLTVSGTTTTVTSTTVAIADSMLLLAKDQGTSADAVDFGLYGKYGAGGTAKYAGIFRDLSATNDPWTFFDELQAEPGTTVNTGGTGYALAAITAAEIVGTTIDASTDFTIGDTVITDGVVTDSTGLQLAANLDIDGTADISGDLTLSAGGDGALRFSAASSIKILDNSSAALVIEEADNAYVTFVTTDDSEAVAFSAAVDIQGGYANGGGAPYDGVVDAGGGGNWTTLQAGDDALDGGAYSMLVKAGTYSSQNLVVATNNAYIFIEPGTVIDGTITLSGTGIYIQCGNGVDLEGLIISGNSNTFDGGGWETIIDGGTARHAVDITALYNKVQNTSVKTTAGGGNAYDGVRIHQQTNQIVNVQCINSDRYAFHSDTDGYDAAYIGCVASDSDDHSFYIASTRNRIVGCHAIGAGTDGYHFAATGDHGVMTGSVSRNPGAQSVEVVSLCTDVVITGNRLDGAITDGGTNTIASGNSTVGF